MNKKRRVPNVLFEAMVDKNQKGPVLHQHQPPHTCQQQEQQANTAIIPNHHYPPPNSKTNLTKHTHTHFYARMPQGISNTTDKHPPSAWQGPGLMGKTTLAKTLVSWSRVTRMASCFLGNTGGLAGCQPSPSRQTGRCITVQN